MLISLIATITKIPFGVTADAFLLSMETQVGNTISVQVSASHDDAGAWWDWRGFYWDWTLDKSHVSVGRVSFQYNGGLRFVNVDIPQGTNIISAILEVCADQTCEGTGARWNIYGENANSNEFSTQEEFLARPKTTAVVDTGFFSVWVEGTWYSTPDLSSVVQEIINRADWQAGNALALLLFGHPDARTTHEIRSYDKNPTQAAKLTIIYGVGDTYNLAIFANPGGTTLPSPGNYTLYAGSTIECTAIAFSGYNFSQWNLDGVYFTDNPFYIRMNSSHTLTAIFFACPVQYTLTITSTAGGETAPKEGVYEFEQGTVITVKAIPWNNYNFGHWELDSTNIGSENPIDVKMTKNYTLLANFTQEIPPIKYSLNISATMGGTTNPVPNIYLYNEGTIITVEALPEIGYFFNHWMLDNTVYPSKTLTIVMNTNHTVLAVFLLKNQTISVVVFGYEIIQTETYAQAFFIAFGLNSLCVLTVVTVVYIVRTKTKYRKTPNIRNTKICTNRRIRLKED